MLSKQCKELLQRHDAMKSRSQICRELSISGATLSQVLADKYPASTDNIEERIMRIYGSDGRITCPVLGSIEVGQCADNFEKAMKIRSCGNPATRRLYAACRKCDFRG